MKVNNENHSYNLSRIDRSVADNLKDLDVSFDIDSKLVLDFIIFMSKKLNNNLFGFTRFTIKEFSEFTGMNVVDLCAQHPLVESGVVKAPIYEDHKFESVLEYTLYRMLKTNIIFSKVHSYRENGDIIKLENFPILKDIYLERGGTIGARKVYEVRLSDTIIDGFVKRYYNLDTTRLPQIGKGKGGHQRKKLFVWLNKIFHIYESSPGQMQPYSIDYLADIAGVRHMSKPDAKGFPVEKEPKHKKESVKNILVYLSKHINTKDKKSHFSFDWEFVRGNGEYVGLEDYFVKFTFTSNMDALAKEKLAKTHTFKLKLLKELREAFDAKYPRKVLVDLPSMENEADPFQRWLNNSKAELDLKIMILKKHYSAVHNDDKKAMLKDNEAKSMIINGILDIDYIGLTG